MSFAELGLSEELLRAVADHGYTTPTPIQKQAIPAVLAGGDLLAGAQTGTGKTAGFTLPILQRLTANPLRLPPGSRSPIRALVLTPTRELAAQVEESVKTYGRYTKIRSTVVFGGVGFTPQAERLRRGVDILVATPGRLLDHVGQRTVDLSKVEILVLDEADRMLDMGFIHDIKKVLALLPKQRQNLLFSATFSDEIQTLANSLLNKPAMIEVAKRNAVTELVTQRVHHVDRENKRHLLAHLITEEQWNQVLVFTRTKHCANRLAEQLDKGGITAMAIHGNKSQGARTTALARFKSGDLRVLVATDIAARGIDIVDLPHVINFELPNVPQDYVHRIGRTGRAGQEGHAISLVCIDEFKLLADIERLLKIKLPNTVVKGFEPDLSIKAEPIPNGRNGVRMQSDRPRQGPPQGNRPREFGGGRSNADRKAGGYANARPSAERSGGGSSSPNRSSMDRTERSGNSNYSGNRAPVDGNRTVRSSASGSRPNDGGSSDRPRSSSGGNAWGRSPSSGTGRPASRPRPADRHH